LYNIVLFNASLSGSIVGGCSLYASKKKGAYQILTYDFKVCSFTCAVAII
jgi:hypothetical protein